MPNKRAESGGRDATSRCFLACLLFLVSGLSACRTFDDPRVLQTLNQRGFGRKYVGDANEVLTLGVGDQLTIADANNQEIIDTLTIRLDGVVSARMIGEVFVAGFTTQEIAQALNARYAEYYTDTSIMVTPTNITSKRFYMHGETALKGAQPLLRDTTVWDAVMATGVLPTASLSDIRVIRSDPRHPLIIPIDLDKMLEHGDSSDNILLREDDIVIIRPNFAGWVKNGVELILAPLMPVTQLLVSVRNIQTIADSFSTDKNFYVGARGGYGGGGGYYGGYGGARPAPYGEENPVVVPPGGSDSSGE
ncbi:MAG: polysaccharide biosynthesis/export family protein [Planctomycetes bacterium]|nr:polysaccharide biosynthesis/export family protein [Planctomycetota bacterium]